MFGEGLAILPPLNKQKRAANCRKSATALEISSTSVLVDYVARDKTPSFHPASTLVTGL